MHPKTYMEKQKELVKQNNINNKERGITLSNFKIYCIATEVNNRLDQECLSDA